MKVRCTLISSSTRAFLLLWSLWPCLVVGVGPLTAPATSLTNSSSSGLLRFFGFGGFEDEADGRAAEPARTIGVGFVVGVAEDDAGSVLGGMGDVELDIGAVCGMRSVVGATFGRCGWLAARPSVVTGSGWIRQARH